MMNLRSMKTIADLNSKWWYRLVKVIFITASGLLILLLIIWVGAETEPRGFNSFEVTCNYGNKDKFIAYERGIYLIDLDLKNGIASIPDNKKELIQEECAITEEEMTGVFDSILADENPPPLFSASKTRYTEGSWGSTIFFQLIAVVVAFAFMQLIRRCFYYVLLGSFRPSKH